MIPRAVKAAPDERKMMPSLRLLDVSTVGSFGGDDDLRRCFSVDLQMRYETLQIGTLRSFFL